MQYKFEFIPDDRVPNEYAERHLERQKREGLEKIVKMIAEHYPYKIRKDFDGKEIYQIELICTSTSKLDRCMDQINGIFAWYPKLAELRKLVSVIIEEMFYPDAEEATQNKTNELS